MESIQIGTIVPFAGQIENDDDKKWLEDQGWLLCDGRILEKENYVHLALILGTNFGGTSNTFHLPDLKGRFIRGVDHESGSDPDASKRSVINPGGASGDAVGSWQVGATGISRNNISTTSDGNHTHSVSHAPRNNNAYAVAGRHYGIWNNGSVNTETGGEHTHTISGWDSETRPKNKTVYYIIKYKN